MKIQIFFAKFILLSYKEHVSIAANCNLCKYQILSPRELNAAGKNLFSTCSKYPFLFSKADRVSVVECPTFKLKKESIKLL